MRGVRHDGLARLLPYTTGRRRRLGVVFVLAALLTALANATRIGNDLLETLTSIRRAGADAIVTYYAKEAAGWLR